MQAEQTKGQQLKTAVQKNCLKLNLFPLTDGTLQSWSSSVEGEEETTFRLNIQICTANHLARTNLYLRLLLLQSSMLQHRQASYLLYLLFIHKVLLTQSVTIFL